MAGCVTHLWSVGFPQRDVWQPLMSWMVLHASMKLQDCSVPVKAPQPTSRSQSTHEGAKAHKSEGSRLALAIDSNNACQHTGQQGLCMNLGCGPEYAHGQHCQGCCTCCTFRPGPQDPILLRTTASALKRYGPCTLLLPWWLQSHEYISRGDRKGQRCRHIHSKESIIRLRHIC